jgi:hypothetical protein
MSSKWNFLLPLALFIASCGSDPNSALRDRRPEEILPVDHDEEIIVGAFNFLRLGRGEKDVTRMVKLVATANYQIFAGVEIMNTESAFELLDALREETGKPWELILSKKSTGESAYREYLGYFYREDQVRPIHSEDTFCATNDATDRYNGGCFAKDRHAGGVPQFERDPFVANFSIGDQELALAAVHLYYGSYEAEKVRQRKREMMNLKSVMEKMRRASPRAQVMAMGDFNLTLDAEGSAAISEKVPRSFYNNSDVEVVGLIDGPTTIGFSNYDHIFYYKDTNLEIQPDKTTTILDFVKNERDERREYKEKISDHYPVRAVFRK